MGMDFNKTIDMIINDLRETREIIDDLKNYPGVPQLQIEIAKSRCKSAEEVISLLKTFTIDRQGLNDNDGKYIAVPEQNISRVSDKPIETGDEDNLNPIRQEKTTGSGQKSEPDRHIRAEGQRQTRRKKGETRIIADRFTHMSNRFNEHLGSGKKDKDVSSMLQSTHLVNLADAIGVNDKFLFIREIFNGNRDNYEEAIVKLEKVDNLSDAMAIISSVTGESEENDAVKQLLELVKRKLPENG